jgi:hypothetical protein
MQNREELRQKGTTGVDKQQVARGGQISLSEGGGGEQISFSNQNIEPCRSYGPKCTKNTYEGFLSMQQLQEFQDDRHPCLAD